jgi:hypothetical protein
LDQIGCICRDGIVRFIRCHGRILSPAIWCGTWSKILVTW